MSESKALQPVEEVKKNITAMTPSFKAALPPHVSAEKFVRTVITAIQTTPALVRANRQSLYAAAMKCASAGLLPDGKEAALVPYGTEVQYLPMIGGVLKQVRNSGELSSITAQVVHENDLFRYWVDHDGEHINYEPNFFIDRGAMIGVFAMATMKDGGLYVEVMTKSQIEDVRAVSKAKNGPAWAGDFYGEMARKTVLRRLAKRLPISTDKTPALDSENEQFDFEMVREAKPEVEVTKEAKKPNRMTAIIKAKKSDPDPVENESPDLEIESIPEQTAEDSAPI